MAKQPGAKVVAIEALEGVLSELETLPAVETKWIARRVREAVELLEGCDEVRLREHIAILEAQIAGANAELVKTQDAIETAVAYLSGRNAASVRAAS